KGAWHSHSLAEWWRLPSSRCVYNIPRLSPRPHSACERAAIKLDPKGLVTLDELALSTMWETSALVEVVEGESRL
ncbi:hypothetical protein MYX04_14065, partial [Nitrospiraceae bacterium AH_259_D15_M11_P09]|nr:hypothetical protein [Nitrospiraceae bacterium AH_259_D15_M11_P09]